MTTDDGADSPESSTENGSERLIDALTVNTESAAESARHIGDRIILLAGTIMMASDQFKSAGIHSPRLGRLIIAVLVLVTLISAGAATFCAWEAKELVEVMKQEVQHRP